MEICGHSNDGAVCVRPKNHEGLHSVVLDPPSSWSDVPPDKIGWYFWRGCDGDDWTVKEVFPAIPHGQLVCVGGEVSRLGGQWQGPLEPKP